MSGLTQHSPRDWCDISDVDGGNKPLTERRVERSLPPNRVDLKQEILKEIAFSNMIDRGLADSAAGQVITNEAMKEKIKNKWK